MNENLHRLIASIEKITEGDSNRLRSSIRKFEKQNIISRKTTWFKPPCYSCPQSVSDFNPEVLRELVMHLQPNELCWACNKHDEMKKQHPEHFMYIFDTKRKTNIYTERSVKKYLGYDLEDIRRMGDQMLDQVICQKLRDTLAEARYEALANDNVAHFSYKIKDKDGCYRYIFGLAIPKKDGAGNMLTELKKALDPHDAFRACEFFYEVSQDHVPSWFQVSDITE